MMVKVVRWVLLIALGCATLTACGEGEASVPETDPRRADVARQSSPAESDGDQQTSEPGSSDTEEVTAAAPPDATEPGGSTDAAPTATEEESRAPQDPPVAHVDWRNTAYEMRINSGGDLEELSFVDGVAQTTVIVAVTVDPANPQRAAMASTTVDSEGFPLIVNAGIFALDSSGVARPEAQGSGMSGLAIEVHLCPGDLVWDADGGLTLEYGGCDGDEPDVMTWTRDGAELMLDDGTGDTAAPDAGSVDVSAYDEVHFTSPSGAIACTMSAANGGWAVCEFPLEMDPAQLPAGDLCGEFTTLMAVGVGSQAGWVCSGGAIVGPEVGSPFTAWFAETGWEPAVSEVGGLSRSTATVPYGSTLVLDNVRCRSADDGMHCHRPDSGAGFSVARAGVEFTGPRTDIFTELWD